MGFFKHHRQAKERARREDNRRREIANCIRQMKRWLKEQADNDMADFEGRDRPYDPRPMPKCYERYMRRHYIA